MMNVDEALKKLRECDHYLDELDVVKAEVERLRAENLDLQQALSQQAENCTSITSKLEAENAELRARNEWLSRSAHAQETDTRLDVLRNKNAALKARLAWFEERDLLRLDQVKAYYGANIDETDVLEAIDQLITWEREHPKPPEGT
jgi:hypothetical protein